MAGLLFNASGTQARSIVLIRIAVCALSCFCSLRGLAGSHSTQNDDRAERP
jgi:hypothetical protein